MHTRELGGNGLAIPFIGSGFFSLLVLTCFSPELYMVVIQNSPAFIASESITARRPTACPTRIHHLYTQYQTSVLLSQPTSF